ncbi:PLP-dependent transferase [Cryphonectria parasitica EP155]|uniref:PLP-dependent transferase n=1 Tax=Cryphonectria parasitica (strain ATCC 38755 / EP155) TaxID=660469 RepID=A0A9P4XTA0_CRYP1|nr:PLP-dependent transferase [Cryphonectria parasitica EP155]KAF3760392.1 PLP-dependent transferase [Cryphonectria parasitica EP155]
MSSALDDVFSFVLARRQSRGLLRRLTTPTQQTPLVDFSSNDYLSLSCNPDLKRSYISRLQTSGEEFGLGSGGSRLLDGNTTLAETLEQTLAEFHGAGAALLFNSGYEANTGLLACVPRAGDVVVLDELVHASVHAGVKLCRAARVGSARDQGTNLESLSGVLRATTGGEDGRAVREGRKHVFIAVEAVYSMDGDLAPLCDIVRCVEQYLPLGNGHVIVDEAHSNGLFGTRGRGLVCELDLESRVWARVHTFGKALGCSGAIVLCSPVTRQYLINYARTLIYTTAMGFPGLASIQVAYEFITSDQAEALRRHLQGLIEYTRARLSQLCLKRNASAEVIRIHPGSIQSPIIPVFVRQARSLAEHCQGRGYMVRAIVAPTVPQGTDRVRICLHAGNTIKECAKLCEAIEEWVSSQQNPTAETMTIPETVLLTGHAIKNKL